MWNTDKTTPERECPTLKWGNIKINLRSGTSVYYHSLGNQKERHKAPNTRSSTLGKAPLLARKWLEGKGVIENKEARNVKCKLNKQKSHKIRRHDHLLPQENKKGD